MSDLRQEIDRLNAENIALNAQLKDILAELLDIEQFYDEKISNLLSTHDALRQKLQAICPHDRISEAPGIGPFCEYCGTDDFREIKVPHVFITTDPNPTKEDFERWEGVRKGWCSSSGGTLRVRV